LVKCKEKCCFETVLFINHAWETTIVACIFVCWWCSIGCSSLVVIIIVVVWFLSFCMSHAVHTRFSTKLKTTNTLQSPKWLIIGVIKKQKGSKLWLADCCLVMAASSWRIHKWQDRPNKNMHTHHPYYGCCAVKSNHQNSLLIAWLVFILYVCLILSDKPIRCSHSWYGHLMMPRHSRVYYSLAFSFLIHHSFAFCCISSFNCPVVATFWIQHYSRFVSCSCHWFTLAAWMKAMRTSWREPLFSSF
jgi:hypothetical protein